MEFLASYGSSEDENENSQSISENGTNLENDEEQPSKKLKVSHETTNENVNSPIIDIKMPKISERAS
jgi:hypothetical protein